MSFLLISVLLPELSATVEMAAGEGAILAVVVTPVGSAGATGCGLLNRLNFIARGDEAQRPWATKQAKKKNKHDLITMNEWMVMSSIGEFLSLNHFSA